jgi:hypothetical protein
MSDERKGETEPAGEDRIGGSTDAPPATRGMLPLPGLIAIVLYLLLLSVVIVIGVVGGHYPPIFVVLPVFLIAACGGLLMLFRWAWALALAAVLLLASYNLWLFTRLHMGPALVQGLLNLVFFLYLVRTEVREKLR